MLKAYAWWNYKIPPMLAVAFYALYRAPRLPPVTTTLWQLGLFLISVIGIAGFGHVFLDAFDVDEDRMGGKPNLWDQSNPASRAALVLGLLAASWLPWTILPNSSVGLTLIALEFLLFAMYAVPPIRLKTRGLHGVITDAGYAHALPALWTWFPFALVAGVSTSPLFIATLTVWSLTVGIRHLMQHQALETPKDAAAGANTFSVRHGADKTLSIVVHRLIPLEIVAFGLLVTIIGRHLWILPVACVAYLALEAFRLRFLWLQRIRLTGPLSDPDRSTIAGTLIMSQFYELWVPVIVLTGLVARSGSYIIVFVLYLFLFRNGPWQLVRRDLPLVSAWLRSRRVDSKHAPISHAEGTA